MSKLRYLSWSHCCNEWMFYGYFSSEEEAENNIKLKGYDLRFFKIDNEGDIMSNKWISVDDRLPEPGEMVIIFTPSCLVTQSYFSGGSFHEPWGDEYARSKQPKLWQSLPEPPTKEIL